jgi:hypothetical protein
MNIDFLFQSSPWLIPLCLVVAAVYTVALYQAKPVWSKTLNYVLATGRFVLVSLLCLLLLNLLLRQVRTTIEKKTIVLAVDNSLSMLAEEKNKLKQWLADLTALKAALEDEDYEVSIQTLDDSPLASVDSVRFVHKTSNLANLLGTLRNNYEGRNLTDVVLLTDGIYNQGPSPTVGNYTFAVHTVGLGDTIPKKDVNLKTLYANKVAYLGNQFPIQADVLANGFAGKTTNVVLKQGDKILERKQVTFGQAEAFAQVAFQAISALKGVQHYTVLVEPLGGEYSTRNNRQELYIDIIDGKEKILLLALAPHPDLKALKSIIEKNQNYELDLKILSLNPELDYAKKYDLLVLHQLPDYFNAYNETVKRFVAQGMPCFYVLGNQSSTTQVNALATPVQIASGPGQTDKVTGYFNPNFKLLNFDPEQLDLLKQLPPLSVPFGESKLAPGAEVLLYQRVGSVSTQKPLLVIGTGSSRSAILMGEGLWGWRLEEYDLTDRQELVDEIILKTIQYISVKDDKRKLRVYPLNDEFLLGDKVTFETEVYNDIYEKLYNQSIKLEVQDERNGLRSFSYTTSEGNTRFDISGLPQGVYRYKASTTVLGKNEEVAGEFVVRDVQLEDLTTTADHNTLRQLAQQTGGKFFGGGQFEDLKKTLLNRTLPDKIDSVEELQEPINLRWILVLLLTLATAEWIARKYLGGY